ncbi:MAG: signal transduction histidine kinase [Marinoscillum sp.]|jgi:signal transduction histidine kinase
MGYFTKKWFLEAGLTEDTPIAERYKVFFLNRILLFCAVMGSILIVADLFTSLYSNAISNSVLLLVYWALFYLHHQKRYFLVRNSFTGIMIVFISYFSIAALQQGRWTDTEIIMFGVFAGTFFLYNGLSRKLILLIIVGTYIGLKAYKFYYLQLEFDNNFFLTILNMSIALSSVAFFMAIFEKELKNSIGNIVALNLDLNHQKRLLEVSESNLQEINKTNKKLFSIVAHDLRNPMNLMYGLVELSDNKDITEAELSNLKSRTKENLKNVVNTMNNVLIWAKSHLDGFIPSMEKLELHPLCQMIFSQFTDISTNKKLKLKVEFDPNIKVKSDEILLSIIIRNIISNAIKYSNIGGEITINASLVNDEVCLEFHDNGLGFKQETIDSITKGEFVYSQKGTNEEVGTGLGLNLSNEMLKTINSRLMISSKEHEGSTVTIYLPVAEKSKIL